MANTPTAHAERAHSLRTMPWIRIRSVDGVPRRIGLNEALLDAHHIRNLDFDSAAEQASVLRFLIQAVALVAREVQMTSDEYVDFEDMVQAGFPRASVTAVLDRLDDVLWMSHPETPFLQTTGFSAKADTMPISSLFPLNPGGSSKAWWGRPGDGFTPDAVAPEKAVAWLLTAAAFSTPVAGRPSGTTYEDMPLGLKGRGNIGKGGRIYIIQRGENLAQTLLANVMPEWADDESTGLPLWAYPHAVNPVGALTQSSWTGTAFQLVFEEGRVTGYRQGARRHGTGDNELRSAQQAVAAPQLELAAAKAELAAAKKSKAAPTVLAALEEGVAELTKVEKMNTVAKSDLKAIMKLSKDIEDEFWRTDPMVVEVPAYKESKAGGVSHLVPTGKTITAKPMPAGTSGLEYFSDWWAKVEGAVAVPIRMGLVITGHADTLLVRAEGEATSFAINEVSYLHMNDRAHDPARAATVLALSAHIRQLRRALNGAVLAGLPSTAAEVLAPEYGFSRLHAEFSSRADAVLEEILSSNVAHDRALNRLGAAAMEAFDEITRPYASASGVEKWAKARARLRIKSVRKTNNQENARV